MEDQLPAENSLVIPDAGRRSPHPRHGGVPRPGVKIAPSVRVFATLKKSWTR